MMETVLITGGLGYVGGRISKFFSEKSEVELKISTRRHDVKAPEWLKTGKIVALDLMSESQLEAAVNGVKCIVHLAALNEIDSLKDPKLALTVNGLGSLNLLNAAQNAGVERFIYFSTAHVYGAPLKGFITEKSLARPLHPYAISHRTAEDFVLAAHDSKAIIGIVLRLSNGFGAPVRADTNRWTLLINDLCRQAVTTKRLVLRSSGLQKRDFITLHDVSRAVQHVMNLSDVECADGLFNLGGECALKIIDMAELVAERCSQILGFKPEIRAQEPLPQETSNDLAYVIDKIKSTGFSLEKNLQEEIDATIRFCKNAFSR
jgi:UDP-glucose 4-epimerase